jgi:hypothetical protein
MSCSWLPVGAAVAAAELALTRLEGAPVASLTPQELLAVLRWNTAVAGLAMVMAMEAWPGRVAVA